MTENYITLSLETHLFFARIMKEHALFLGAGFPCKDSDWFRRADRFRRQFEELLEEVLAISSGRVNGKILESDELVTEFTLRAEKQTGLLSGIPINTDLTGVTQQLRPCPRGESDRSQSRPGSCGDGGGRLQACPCVENDGQLRQRVHRINARSMELLNGIIDLKEDILREVSAGRLFTTNYPLLIEHILREAMLYRSSVSALMRDRGVSYQSLWGTEAFWNRIMMEHALFIRGLLDPSEEELILQADGFASDYKKLLEAADSRERKAANAVPGASLAETRRYRDFKAAGTEGILDREIASIILPLLADHVLREANHYIRILECADGRGMA